MNDVVARARALREIIDSVTKEPAALPVTEAVIACSRDLINAGEAKLALDLIERAPGLARSSHPSVLLRFNIVRARALRGDGQFQNSLALSTELLSGEAERLRSIPELAYELRINEASCLIHLNRADEAVRRLILIRSELSALPDSALLASCSFQLSTAEILRGEHRAARGFTMEAIVFARRSGNRFLEAAALDNMNRLERACCRWSSAEEAAQDALGIFDSEGSRIYANIARRCLGIIQWKRGRLEEASRLATVCIEDASRIGSDLHEWYASLLKGMVLLHAGSFQDSLRLFTSGVDWDVPEAHSRPSLLTTEFLGDVHLEQGRAAEALRLYDEVWPKALALVPKGDIVAELRRRRAEAYYLQGRHSEAYEEAKTGLEHCRELGDRYEEAATYRVLALSAAATGRATEAKQWFEQGFAYYDDIETPYEWGKLWLAYGDWLRGSHADEFADPHGALEAYQAARDHFERMGAVARLAEANSRIAAIAGAGSAGGPRSEVITTVQASEAPKANPVDSATSAPTRRPRRRPRAAAELDRRSEWARDTFRLITRHKPLLNLLGDVMKLAKSNAPILVLGESGTGKELIANGLHRLSGRSGSFMPINCSTLPREIIESELFGYVPGAFTGATREKPGLLEVCAGGTVFLDEIAEMPLELQSRLLRFLETGEVRRVGATRNLRVDTRVVAATNRERAVLEKAEAFRQDLYYRLAHAVVVLPPLRRRGEDVEMLSQYFLDEACAEEEKRVTLSDAAWKRLRGYAWPGNVRQLRAVIRLQVLLSPPGHEVKESELELDEGRTPATLTEELEQAERRRLSEALLQAGGSRTEAAKALGMPRTTLINKLRRYGIG